ncbi:MAG: 6-phosphogluconolactonase [Desulfobacteraceae bacterium]|nr:6-phosphogluconolactonase [Desulfobacteraceae bacterium]
MTVQLARPEIRTYANLELAALKAADQVQKTAAGAIRRHGFFTLVLAGGSTPRRLYEILASPPYSSRQAWQDFHLFWGDERCVAPDRPESNFGMAKEALLDRVAIPAGNVHRMRAEVGAPAEAAATYEQELRDFFALHPGRTADGYPRFDLVLLGLGEDGHTASLFPGSEAAGENEKWVAAAGPRGKPEVARITMTLPVLNNADNVLFLVSGTAKQGVMREIIDRPEAAAARFPAARVQPKGHLYWFAAHGA